MHAIGSPFGAKRMNEKVLCWESSLVIQRMGFGAVLSEAVRDALPEWYEAAVLDAGVTPIGDPDIEMESTPDEEGQPLTFKFEVGVRPVAKLGDY